MPATSLPALGVRSLDKRPLIGTSWKMNKTRVEAEHYVSELVRALDAARHDVEVFVLPSHTALGTVCEMAAGQPLMVGAQNMHWEDGGAYTGEISPTMVRECGASIVELGHFERRTFFGETDWDVNRKVLSAIRHGLVPLVCVGETQAHHDFSVAHDVVAYQTKIALHGIPEAKVTDVIVAYEPGWAIGAKGTHASADEVNRTHAIIRAAIESKYGRESASRVRILYGGGVTSDNAAEFAMQPELDGLFVGRAALDARSFLEILDVFCWARGASAWNATS